MNRVTDEQFDRTRVIGRTYAEVAADSAIEWESCYPLVDEQTQVVGGIVDGNWPNESGDWRIVDDRYAVMNT